jgi:DNA polymerase-3 subunit epsilon
MIPRGLKRFIHARTLKDERYRCLFEPPPPGEYVSIDCETTGLDRRKDQIITIAAVKIKGDVILSSERFVRIARPETELAAEAIKVHHLRKADVENAGRLVDIWPDFLDFVGARPLVGYYLEFDVAMINRGLKPFLGAELPNDQIEVSSLYYDLKYGGAPAGTTCDLTFRAIMRDLGIPEMAQHDAFNDAMMTAMIYVALRDRKRRGATIPRQREQAQDKTTYGA